MLNKNQSKKSNSWKYYVVIPALAAFVLLFQIEVIAKEKRETPVKFSKKGNESIDVFKIKKTTTDQELKVIAEKLKLNHNIDFTISDLKRNSQNELTAIKLNVKRGSEEAQEYQVSGDKAIKDCGVIVLTEADGSKKISLATDNQVSDSGNKTDKIKIVKVQNSKTNNDVNTNSNTSTKADCVVSTTSSATVNTNVDEKTSTKIVIKSVGHQILQVNNDPLVIVDGIVIGNLNKEDLNIIDPENIKAINVLKSPEAKAKYGEDAIHGAIIIETKK